VRRQMVDAGHGGSCNDDIPNGPRAQRKDDLAS
jgi:hypothetical protein